MDCSIQWLLLLGEQYFSYIHDENTRAVGWTYKHLFGTPQEKDDMMFMIEKNRVNLQRPLFIRKCDNNIYLSVENVFHGLWLLA
jgi:hypothetical protein